MKLVDIHPAYSPSYSRNLHRWLAEFGHGGGHAGEDEIVEHVYRVTPMSLLHRRYDFAPGELMIGREYADPPHVVDFSGAQLMHVLTLGRQALRMCYPGGTAGLERIDDFWEHYAAVGRCVIDPNHQLHFVGDSRRFQVHADGRICLWCGARLSRAAGAPPRPREQRLTA